VKDRLCVLGLGYIGLPTASMFAVSGHQVTGVDVNPDVVEALKSGRVHLEEPDLNTLVEAAIRSGNLRIQAEPALADVFIIAVSTPLGGDRRAELGQVQAAARALVPYLRAGNLVVLESTVPPGTTRDVLAPILEQSGLRAGEDFHLAHCPERVLPGAILLELVQNERTVGGLTPACARRAADVYRGFAKGEIHVTDCTTAEMVKVMENTYRDINIALANELALIAERIGVDVWEAIRLANRHPRVSVLRPGPGVGGHCIAVDPWFLVEAAPERATLIRAGRQVNDAMPAHVLELLRAHAHPADGPVALLGVTYKGDTDDTRESPALAVLQQALSAGYQVRVFDPHATSLPRFGHLLCSLDQAVADVAAIIVLSDHAEFRKLNVASIAPLVRHRMVIDTRNCLELPVWKEHGFHVLRLGDGRGRAVPAAI
jgi:UDP-N-acetyl-D-mannosaminuronic acid dehydrogenase